MTRRDKPWYVARGKKQRGPYSQSAVLRALAQGKLKAATRVWKTGMAEWLPLREVPELAEALAQVPRAATRRSAVSVCAPDQAALAVAERSAEAGVGGGSVPNGRGPRTPGKQSHAGKLLGFGCLGMLLLSCCLLSLPKLIFTLFPEFEQRIHTERRAERQRALELLGELAARTPPDYEAEEQPLPRSWRAEPPVVLYVDQPFLAMFGNESWESIEEHEWWCRSWQIADLAEDLAGGLDALQGGRASKDIITADLVAVFYPSYFMWPRDGDRGSFFTGVCSGLLVYFEVASGKAVGRAHLDVESSELVSADSGFRIAGVPIQTSSFTDQLYQDFAANIDQGLEDALARLRGAK